MARTRAEPGSEEDVKEGQKRMKFDQWLAAELRSSNRKDSPVQDGRRLWKPKHNRMRWVAARLVYAGCGDSDIEKYDPKSRHMRYIVIELSPSVSGMCIACGYRMTEKIPKNGSSEPIDPGGTGKTIAGQFYALDAQMWVTRDHYDKDQPQGDLYVSRESGEQYTDIKIQHPRRDMHLAQPGHKAAVKARIVRSYAAPVAKEMCRSEGVRYYAGHRRRSLSPRAKELRSAAIEYLGRVGVPDEYSGQWLVNACKGLWVDMAKREGMFDAGQTAL